MKTEVLKALSKLVYQRLNTDYVDDFKIGYVATWHISNEVDIPTFKARYWLHKLEADGLVKSDKTVYNNILWTLTDIPGWRPAKYRHTFEIDTDATVDQIFGLTLSPLI